MINKKSLAKTITEFALPGLEQFIKLLPDIAMIVTPEGLILHQNHAAAELFPAEDSWLETISPVTGWPFQPEGAIEIDLTTPNGDSRTFQTQVSDALQAGYDGYLVVMRDITDQKKQDREHEAVIAISTALRGMQTRFQIFSTVLNRLENLMEIEKAIIISPHAHSSKYFIELVRGIGEEYIGRELPEDLSFSNLIEKQEPLWIADITPKSSFSFLDYFHDMQSAAIFPLAMDEKHIGAIAVAKRGYINQGQFNLLSIIAGITAGAIQRATLDEKANQSLQRLTALRILNLAVSGSLDLNKTLNVLLDQITNQLHVDAADIYLYDPDTRLLKHTARSGFWTNYGEHIFLKPGEDLPGQIALKPGMIQYPSIADHKQEFLRVRMIENERFISYYAVPLLSNSQVKGVLELFSRRPVHLDDHWINFLEALAAEAAVAIDNAELIQQLHVSNDELTLAYDATIQGWSRTLELRDHETKGHSERVVDLTLQLAREMGISDSELLHMRRGAMLHDIGKTGIPDSILLKTGPLNGDETGVMQLHPEYAMKLLSGIPFLQPALDIPYCHHEKWNGTGYPQGLKGEDIPLAARIFAVVDVFDALSYERPYRGAWSRKKVLEYIRQQSGEHFDPKVVKAFLKLIQEQDQD